MRMCILKNFIRSSMIAGALTAGTFAHAESGVILKNCELRATPFSSANIVAELNAKQKIDITARKGAWANIKTSTNQQGWVRVLNIRTGSGQRGDAGVNAIASVFRTGSSGNTVSTGVKGLSEEQLTTAQANPAELARLTQYKNAGTDARTFAKQAKLTTQTVDYVSATGDTEKNNAGAK